MDQLTFKVLNRDYHLFNKQQERDRITLSKIKELPYQQGYDAAKAGKRTKDNPYWEGYEQGLEWAFHSWLHGWSDASNGLAFRRGKTNNEIIIKEQNEN